MKVLIPAGSIETNFVEETSTLQVNKKKMNSTESVHTARLPLLPWCGLVMLLRIKT